MSRDHRRDQGGAAPHISPLDGYPATQKRRDGNGGTKIVVDDRYLTPAGAKAADDLAILFAIVVWIFCMFSAWRAPDHAAVWILLSFIAAGVGNFGMRYELRRSFRRRLKVELTREMVSVHGLWGVRHFDRHLPHGFAMIRHDRTSEERRRIDIARRTGNQTKKPSEPFPYFGESSHISFEYMGQRNDIATVFGRPAAQAIVARLKACLQIIDGEARTGDGVATKPGDEWAMAPGEIPEPPTPPARKKAHLRLVE